MKVTADVKYVGVNDHKIELFEAQYAVPNGMAYNSYVILDEKIAVMDTVDADFAKEWIQNLKGALGGKTPDYLIVQHMEPDHSANVLCFMELYPQATVVASDKAFVMMRQFFGHAFEDRRIVIKDGDTLCLGKHVLTFIAAPMVHWPEVIVTYDAFDKVLFSADGFGKFGALDVEDDWACEARRYYFGIVGKYGVQVQKLLEKVKKLKVQIICPLHGPVLAKNLDYYLNLYDIWSSYRVETEGVLICYCSIYGNTEKAVELLAEKLKEKGCGKVVVKDLTHCDMAEAVEDAFRYGKMVLASPTYNGGVFPKMWEFLHHLTERNYQKRFIAFMENGTWSPTAAKSMEKMLENCKDITFAEAKVTLYSALSEESRKQMDALADELCQ
uniref:FprA family A-type flavoprotein n=1 Tax=Agathobacter sp. TaxID=2021311 RepID=UPI004056E39F